MFELSKLAPILSLLSKPGRSIAFSSFIAPRPACLASRLSRPNQVKGPAAKHVTKPRKPIGLPRLVLCGQQDSVSAGHSDADDALSVLCVGETLWDCIPDVSCFLGGAPTNVAVHLASLLLQQQQDLQSAKVGVASCVGKDSLGTEAISILKSRGVDTTHLQRHATCKTGRVTAKIDPNSGDASYTFDTPAAWDYLDYTVQGLEAAIRQAKVVVIGSISGRLGDDHEAKSAETLKWTRQVSEAVVLDVNLRSPWYTPTFVLQTLARGYHEDCDSVLTKDDFDSPSPKPLALLKVNDDELSLLETWCNLDKPSQERSLKGDSLRARMRALGLSTNASRVCVTRGEKGAALWCSSTESQGEIFVEHDGYPWEAATKVDDEESDTVGAGDAFLAALIQSLFLDTGKDAQEAAKWGLQRACALGGYVARCQGATPLHDSAPQELREIFTC